MQKRVLSIFVCKVLNKMRLSRIAYSLVHFIVQRKVIDIKDTQSCEAILKEVSPDQGKSCVTDSHPLISHHYDLQIIIPAYNVEKYVANCLDSVFSQQTSYRYLVVVVNDGSTDHTADVLSKYAGHEDTRIITQTNRGLSGARNKGLEVIDAEYVTFLDSDDQLMPGAIQKLMDKATQNGADMVAGGYETFKGNETVTSCHLTPHDDYLHIPGFAWGKIYHSSLFVDIQYPEKYLFEDTLISMILFQKCHRVDTISDVVYRYRVNNQGITATVVAKPKSLDSFWITKRLLEDRKILGIEEKPSVFAVILLRQIYINFSRIYTLGNKEVDKAVFVLSSKMLEEQFDKRPSGLGKYEDLYQALISHNYSAYRWFCLLH